MTKKRDFYVPSETSCVPENTTRVEMTIFRVSKLFGRLFRLRIRHHQYALHPFSPPSSLHIPSPFVPSPLHLFTLPLLSPFTLHPSSVSLFSLERNHVESTG